MNRVMQNLSVYVHMKADENLADNVASELSSRTETLGSEVSAAQAFITPELLAQPEETVEKYLKDPSLRDYTHFLDSLLKQKAHTLSTAEEELLASLSAETLRGIGRSLMAKYYGKDCVIDEVADLWWARVPHFYDSFYVYQYATAMSAANEMVKAMSGPDAATARTKYLEFLKAGSSDYPIQVVKAAGVDMTSTQPVVNLLAEFGSLVDEMEKIIEKQNSQSK